MLQMQNMLNSPQFLDQMAALLSNPQILDQLASTDPTFRGLDPNLREVFQSEHFRRMMCVQLRLSRCK